jgi:hypothetical protein
MLVAKRLLLGLIVTLPVAINVAFADEPNLCQAGIEGSYGGTFGNFPMRLNLICLDGVRMIASMSDQDPGAAKISVSTLLSMPYVQADGANVVASIASLQPEDRKGISSKSHFTYLKLDMAGLRAGVARGIYFNGNVRSFLPVAVRKIQALPELTAASDPVDARLLSGTYSFVAPPLGGAGVLLADVVFGAPFLSLQMSDGQSIHLVDSAKWDGSGIISASSPTGDAEPDGKTLFYLRGNVVNDREIDFYLVTPVAGLIGPFRALKN